jgi:hypothetical protein
MGICACSQQFGHQVDSTSPEPDTFDTFDIFDASVANLLHLPPLREVLTAPEGHSRVTLELPRVTEGHSRVTLKSCRSEALEGHFGAPEGHYRVTLGLCRPRALCLSHLFPSSSHFLFSYLIYDGGDRSKYDL